jgi:hypothetical protein
MFGRLAALLVMVFEMFRYLVSEIRFGHTSTRGFLAHQFMANELLANRYTGLRKQVVVSYVLFAAARNNDMQALHIALQDEIGRAAIGKLGRIDVIETIRRWSRMNDRPDIVALADSRLREIENGAARR